MRISSTISLTLGSLAAAHPFVIIKSLPAAPTQLVRRDARQSQSLASTVAAQPTGIAPRQDGKSTKEEKDDKDSKTTASVVVVLSSAAKTSSVSASSSGVRLVPPITQSFTSSVTASADYNEDTSTTTSDARSASTVRAASSSTIRSTSTSSLASPTSTPASSLRSSISGTSLPIAQSTATPTPDASTSSSSSDTGLSPGGLACAIIFPIAIFLIAAFLVFKFHPRSRAWWLAREERKRQQRSYRAGLDGPRKEALTDTTPSTPDLRRSMLQTFFTPSAVVRPGTAGTASTSTSIRRKPVNWGAQSKVGTVDIPPIPEMPAELPASYPSEKTAMAVSAAPMGQLHSYSQSPVPPSPMSTSTHSSSAVSGGMNQNTPHLGFTPISPLSARLAGEKDLPRVPPSESHPVAELDSSPRLSGRRNTNTNVQTDAGPTVATSAPVTRATRGLDGTFRLK